MNPSPLVLLVGLAVLVLPVFLAVSPFGSGESLATPLAMAAVGTAPTDLDAAVAPTLGVAAGLGLGVVLAGASLRWPAGAFVVSLPSYPNCISSSIVRSPNSQSAWSTAYSRSAGWRKPSASSTITGR